MPDVENNKAASEGADATKTGENGADNGSDQGTDKEQKSDATKTGSEDAGKGEGQKDGEGAKDTSKGNENAKAPKEGSQKDDDADDGAEPPSRKRLSKQDFIIGRQHKKLEKAKADAGADDKGDEDTGEDDDEIAPEDEALISKVVAKKFAPIIDKSLQADDDKEVSDFLNTNPDFKPFEAKARRYMQHPSRRALPIEAIFYEVAGNSLIKIGAERQKAADAKAKETQTGGGSNRAGEGAKSDWDLPKEDFEAKQERIRRGI